MVVRGILFGLGLVALMAACSSSISYKDAPLGLECTVSSGGGCKCTISNSPSPAGTSCPAADIAENVYCCGPSDWPKLSGYSSSTRPTCECFPKPPPVAFGCSSRTPFCTCSTNYSATIPSCAPTDTDEVCCLDQLEGSTCTCYRGAPCKAPEVSVKKCDAAAFAKLKQTEGSTYCSGSSTTKIATCNVPFERPTPN